MNNKIQTVAPFPTTTLPVTTVEEVPILSARERDAFVSSLEKAEADIACGKFSSFEQHGFVEKLSSFL